MRLRCIAKRRLFAFDSRVRSFVRADFMRFTLAAYAAQSVKQIERQRGKLVVALLVINGGELLHVVHARDAARDAHDERERHQPQAAAEGTDVPLARDCLALRLKEQSVSVKATNYIIEEIDITTLAS